jgi:hypothetical protein
LNSIKCVVEVTTSHALTFNAEDADPIIPRFGQFLVILSQNRYFGDPFKHQIWRIGRDRTPKSAINFVRIERGALVTEVLDPTTRNH